MLIANLVIAFLAIFGSYGSPGNFLIYQDTSSEFEAENFIGKEDLFQPVDDEEMYLETNGQLWIRVPEESLPGQGGYLYVPNIYLTSVEVYRINQAAGEAELIDVFGISKPYRGLDGLTYAIKLPSFKKADELLIRIIGKEVSLTPAYVPIRTGTTEEVLHGARMDISISRTISAMIFGLFLFNLILFLVVREKLYFYYVIYICQALILNFFVNGYLFEFLWPENPEFNLLELPLTFSYLAFLIFIDQLIGKFVNRSWYRPAFILLVCFSLMIVLSMAIPLLPYEVFVNILGMAIPVFTISAILSVKQGRLRIFLILGYAPLMFAILLYTVGEIDLYFNGFIRMHAIQLGIVWELIVFSAYLGIRYNQMESLKRVYQNQNVQLLTDYASRLEKEIGSRTTELQNKNRLLSKQQVEISSQRDLLAMANMELEESKKALEKYNKTLESMVKERTARILKTNDILEKQLKSLEQFSYIAAHNLRAPLARIKGLVNLMKLENHSAAADIMDKLNDSMDDLDEIVTDLGTIIELQTHHPEWSPMDVEKVIRQIQQRISPLIRDSIDWKIDLSVRYINVIPAFFVSILQQCISNSVKFRFEGRQLVIQIRVHEENDYVYLTYSDNGSGFDSARFREKIFEPFQRFNTSKEGKGLGLFLIKRHVDAMGGQVRLLSAPGKGTKFDIELPVRVA